MDKNFIESLKDLSESNIEKRLKEKGFTRCSSPFVMAGQAIPESVLPMGNENHKEVLFIDYNIIRPSQYHPHKCYAIYIRKNEL